MIPLDPMDYDRLPPDDLDACTRCNGEGVIFVWGPDGWEDRDCTCVDGQRSLW